MKKKVFIVGIVIAIVLVVAGSIVAVQKNKVSRSVLVQSVPVVTQNDGEKLLTWEDPAGFTFQYPEGLLIDKHDEDQKNYAHVELTHKDHPGTLIVWAKDPPVGLTDTSKLNTATWSKSDSRLKGATLTDSTLGGQPAKTADKLTTENLYIVGTVFDGLLFTIETSANDKEYWTKIFNIVSDKFAFKPPGEADTSDTQDAVDEEEVLE